MNPIIQFDQVTKRFGKQTALDNVSFDVPPGVVFALLGENGAGKTTSIQTLLGLQKQTSGNVQVFGLPSFKNAMQIRKRIGYVPEQPALYEWMTIKQAGWFMAGFYADGYQMRYADLVSQFELPMEKKIKSLSKGMKAKVSLALSLAHTPELLILDEPTSGLDTMVRRSFLESMVDVAANGQTVFLSSHQIPEVERVADIVAIVNEGKLLVCESLEQLKSRLEQWTIFPAEGVPELPDLSELDLDILSRRTVNRQVRLMVSNPVPETLWQLRDNPCVAEIEVHIPSLEEIFVTFIENSGRKISNPTTTSTAHRMTEEVDQ